jgi:hypothetical protein
MSQFGPTFDWLQARHDCQGPDEVEQCECMFSVRPMDDTWEPLESQDDGDAVRVRCRCRSCERIAWLEMPPAKPETFKRICAWCSCELPGHDPKATKTSHGMCPDCAKNWGKM